MRSSFFLAAAIVGTISAACAPGSNPKLADAEARLRAAEANPTVAENAAVPLHDAQTSVAAARNAFDDGDDEAKVNHLSYLAARRVEIAVAIAEKNAANDDVQMLSKDRTGVVLDARTKEAERAREDADVAEEQAEISALTAAALAAELSALKAKQTERGIVLTLGDVLFDVDRSELKPAALADLDRLAQLLAAEPGRAVLIEGHTDSTGSAQHNDALSQKRADAVSSVLMRRGISPSRITTRGFGASSPLATNATTEGRQENRRVEIVVLDADPASVSDRTR